MKEFCLADGYDFGNDSEVKLYVVLDKNDNVLGFYAYHFDFGVYKDTEIVSFTEAVEDLRHCVDSNIIWSSNAFRQSVGYPYVKGKHPLVFDGGIIEY